MTDFVIFDQSLPIRNPFPVRARFGPIAGHELHVFGCAGGRYLHLERNGNFAVAIGGAIDEVRFRRKLSELLDTEIEGERDLLRFAETMKALFPADFMIIVGLGNTGSLFVTGDVFGAVPVFRTEGAGKVVISTNVDLIGQNLRCEYDAASCLDMIVTRRICFPHTAYEGLTQCDPTAALVVSREGAKQVDVGYRPPRIRPGELVAAVAEGLVDAIRRRVEGRSALVALSGGLDSRIVLAISQQYCDTAAFSITQSPSRDLTLAGLVAEARGIPHERFVISPDEYRGKSSLMAFFCGSQNAWRHAHFLPLESYFQSRDWTMLGGYGSNTNFGEYGNVRSFQGRIARSALPDTYKERLIARWRSHAAHTRERFGIESSRLAVAWPCTQKIAFAHFQVNRRILPTLEPLMTAPAMFAAKAMNPAQKPNVAAELFRLFCADEQGIAVTGPLHPLGETPRNDPSARQRNHPWPRKTELFGGIDETAFPLPDSLVPSGEYRLQLAFIEKFWRDVVTD